MKDKKRKLMIEQLDHKLNLFKKAESVIRPEKGWINAIRTSLNITLTQLGTRLHTSPQNVRSTEIREASGSITINALKEIAEAMDMNLVYAIVPKDQSLEKLIESRAKDLATRIVLRTSASMRLEDQENTKARLEKTIQEKTTELKEELPKYLWD